METNGHANVQQVDVRVGTELAQRAAKLFEHVAEFRRAASVVPGSPPLALGQSFGRGLIPLELIVNVLADVIELLRDDIAAREAARMAKAMSDAFASAMTETPVERALRDERDRYRAALQKIAAGHGKQADRAQRALNGEDFR